jgi:hypothetical protein
MALNDAKSAPERPICRLEIVRQAKFCIDDPEIIGKSDLP